MAIIHLRDPQGNTRHVAVVDADDVKKARKHIWKLNLETVIAKRYRNGKHCHYTLSRFLLGVEDNRILVRHANGDSLDFRRLNLLQINRDLAAVKAKTPTTNKSGYKGVCETQYGKWHAYLHVAGRKFGGGNHASMQDAVKARKRLEAKYF